MKLNSKNIISDADVTVLHQNSTLADVIKQQSNDIDRLKSNVKWLYKYGGVGSGSGGGGGVGGGTGAWYAVISINGTTFTATPSETGNTQTGNLIVNGAGRYPLEIQIIRPRGGTFNTKISYYSGTMVTVNDKLNEDNAWTVKRNINITGNNKISITVTDGEFYVVLNVDYITSPYYLSLKLCNNADTLEHTGAVDKMVDDIRENGLKAKLEYDIGVEVAKDDDGNYNGVTYQVTDIKGNTKESQVLDLSDGMKGTLYLPLCDDADTFLTNNANSATYTFKLDVTVVTNAGGLSSSETFYSTFTLIPSDLYLKVLPDQGTIYPIQQTVSESTYIYGSGTKSFNVTPYFGVLEGKTITVSAYIDKTPDEIIADLLKPVSDRKIIPVMESTSVTERRTISGITINISADNDQYTEHMLVFRASCAGTVAYFTYYIYARLLNSNLLWYPIDEKNTLFPPNKQAYWRDSNNYKNIALTNSMVYTQTASSAAKTINIQHGTNDFGGHDMLFSVGILYSEINDDSQPIISIHKGGSGAPGQEDIITIFPKYITLGGTLGAGTQLTCYIPKTTYNNYTAASKEYHLITIYKRWIDTDSSGNKQYEICAYIDGVLEGVYTSWTPNMPAYSQIVLQPANYYINHIELSHYEAQMNEGGHTNYMSDANIVRYWYTYASQKLDRVDIPYTTLQAYESGVTLLQDKEYYSIPKVLSSTLETIVQNATVPVLCFNVEDGEEFNRKFLFWYTSRYTEAEAIDKFPCSLQYATPDETKLSDINVNNAQFHIEIQGSTTRGYRCKNFELCITPTSEDPITTYLFSPNFDPDKFDSFLPEASFTLKADAVDSSHSNNTAMGDFINKADYVKDLFDDMTKEDCQTGSYTKHVKKCLCGFACLVFVNVTPPGGGAATIYYLGVYNFNLGRKSNFNLGYSDTKNLDSCIETVTGQTGLSKGFHVYSIPTEKTKKIDTFFCAEISGNSNYYDFSQFHQSILFSIDDTDKEGMFDDIVTELPSGEYIGMVQKFVKSVAGAGQWVYKRLCKNFGSYDSPYEEIDPVTKVPINSVPDNSIQYIRDIKTGTSRFTPNQDITFNITTAGNNSTEFNLCINPFADQYRNSGETPDLDYKSAVQYYTICMIFGMFDSVMKNLQIRTWNKKRFYIAFYDMDTCLGVDNAGDDADYFAFSDYWDAAYTEIEHGNITALRPSDIVVYRDFKKPGVKGFDIASSYLFAVAKYAKIFEADLQNEEGDGPIELTDYPASIWAKWRMPGGELETADKFIKNYYQHHLEGIDECSLNYNYRSKYFSLSKNDAGQYETAYHATDIVKFKGRRLEYVRQWLTGRFHIMDAYFNIASVLQPFTKYDIATHTSSPVYLYEGTDTVIMEPRLKDNEIPNANDDVYILHSMFSEQQRFSGKLDMYVRALPYSPLLIIPSGGNPVTMLLFDSGITYNIYKTGTGYNAVNLGGSKSWTYLENINNLSTNCLIDAPNLKNLTGTASADAAISSWVLNVPSIETINLTSSKYSGTLTLEGDSNAMPNLTDVNLSHTGMTLNINKQPALKNITKTNSTDGALEIQNCNSLQKLTLSGKFTSIKLTNFKLNIDWTAVKSTSVEIEASDTADPTFKMWYNDTVEAVTLTGFVTVDIRYCKKLKRITIAGTKTTSIYISGNAGENTLQDLVIDGSKLISLHVSNMNGSGNLSTIKFKNQDPLNLTSLNIRVTPITTLTYANDTYNKEASDFSNAVCGNAPVLWLWPLKNLNSIACDNCSVQYIQFYNPAPGSNNQQWNVINLSNNFKWSGIRRIFGTFKITGAECFHQLGSKFTIHGPKPAANAAIPTYNNTPMWSNDTNRTRAVPIWNIMNDPDNSKPVVINSLYRSGTGVTNMTIGRADCTRMFYGTHLTEFDIYYLLYNIGNATNLTYCFCCEGTYARSTPIWNYAENRNINRYAFRKLTNVTNITWMFRGAGGQLAIASPKLNEDGTVKQPGLFTPLASKLSGYFDSLTFSNYIIDRNVFRTFNPNIKFAGIQYLRYFYTPVIVDDINKYLSDDGQSLVTNIPRNSTDSTTFGNIEGIFDDLPNLIEIHNSINGCDYINWTPDFRFPLKLTTISGSMQSAVASGEFTFPDYFPPTGTTPHPLKNIMGSFKCNVVDYDSRRCTMKLTNSFFANTPNLQRFGCIFNNGTVLEATPGYTSDIPSGITNGTFIGYKKTYDNYPSDILVPCAQNLIQCGSLFEGMVLSGTVKNPCAIFSEATKLQNIDGTFYNFYVNLDLDNQSPFANLPNLQSVNYLFARADVRRLTHGGITNLGLKFFYHGHTDVNTTLYGCYEADLTTSVDPSTNKTTTIYPTTPNQITLSYKRYNQNIRYMSLVFSGCDINTFSRPLAKNDFETNPSYNPFDYVYNTNTKKWTKNANKDTRQYMFYYFFDGDSGTRTLDTMCNLVKPGTTSANFVIPEDLRVAQCATAICSHSSLVQLNIKENSLDITKFFCPPDLFRYSTINCNINQAFVDCGKKMMYNYQPNSESSTPYRTFGTKGRICPWLLQGLTSITKTYEMFKNCKALCSYNRYKINENGQEVVDTDSDYFIPPSFFTYAKNVTNLTGMFEGTYMSANTKLNEVFTPLTGSLIINKIFYETFKPCKVSNVFITNNIQSLTQAFAVGTNGNSNTLYNQAVTFEQIFKAGYTNKTSPLNDWKQCFYGYKNNNPATCIHETTKTLNDNNTLTQNYQYGVITS